MSSKTTTANLPNQDHQLLGLDLSQENLITFTSGKLQFIVMGFTASKQFETMPATVKVRLVPHVHDEYTYVLRLNLYDNDRLTFFSRSAAHNLMLNESDIKKGLCSLREKLEKYRLEQVKHLSIEKHETPLSKKEIDGAREILKADNVLECIEGLLKQAGLVTEHQNGLRLFMILLSRHFDKPLHVLLQGSPQLCRLLLDVITSTVPVNQLHDQTSMSASSIYYTRDRNYWRNKVLYLNYIERNFKGAATIREFIENNYLKRQTTEADAHTRHLYASDKVIEGPICLIGYSDDESLHQRFFQECFFIHVDENENNRKELIESIKKDSAGMIDHLEIYQARRLLREIGKQIKPMRVVIPFALELQIPDKVFQPMKSIAQLLTFIKSVALLHQHQIKPKKDDYGNEYITATPEHLEIALELFKSILIAQSDTLSLNQRNLLERIKRQLKEPGMNFRSTDLIRSLKVSKSVFYREFNALTDLGYIIRSGGNKKTGFLYSVAQGDEYESIQNSMVFLDELVNRIKLSFPEVSRKFPSKIKTSKAQ